MKVAIPNHRGEIAACFEYSAHVTIFTLRGAKVLARMEFDLKSREALDRVRLLRDQGVEVLICGGVQAAFEDLLRASGIRVVSWVAGSVETLLDLFVRNQLVSGSARLGASGVLPAGMAKADRGDR